MPKLELVAIMKILYRTFVLLLACTVCGVQSVVVANGATTSNIDGQISTDLKHRRSLMIMPTPTNSQNIIVKRIGETLNLTCLIKYNETEGENRSTSAEQGIKLAWYLPHMLQNSKQRQSFSENRSHTALTVAVTNLKEADSGTYACEARALDHLGNFVLIARDQVDVTVKPKKNSCGDPSFACSTGECIPKRFVCDGRSDCKDGSDESPSVCGSYPCDGKLRCEDGRCIARHWCCDRSDPNCTTIVSPSCCKQLPIPYLDVNQYSPQSQQFSDMGFLQTTIYTVIGCAMAFMFIITIMVIAICRVHLKRTNLPRYPHHMNQSSQRQDSWGNIFLHSSGGGLPYTSAASGLLVTYNINNGVQFVGRPVNPPPYSEIIRAPPREGPPPPYASQENIATSSTVLSSASPTGTVSTNPQPVESSSTAVQVSSQNRRVAAYTVDNDPGIAATLEPLLSENNNGDINGNSTSEVQVEPDNNVRPEPISTTVSEDPTITSSNSSP